jgi:hypothetical protein
VYALKRIRLTGLDTESAQGFVDEIHLLRRLKGKPSIIQLVDAEVRRAHSPAANSQLRSSRLYHHHWRVPLPLEGYGNVPADAGSAGRCCTPVLTLHTTKASAPQLITTQHADNYGVMLTHCGARWPRS